MTLAIRLDAGDPTPPYEQLRRQLALAIDSGQLSPGTRLPTVRQLAGDLGIAPGTVMRAYSELESTGYLATRRGAGTTVSARAAAPNPKAIFELARSFVQQSRRLGGSDAQILAAVERVLDLR